MTAFEGIVRWKLRNNKAEILQSGEKSVNVPALTAQNVLTIDLSDELKNRTDPREKYLEYKFALTFCAENYAKSVCLSLKTADCVFSDNWFDIHGKEPVTIMIDKASLSRKMTAQELSEELEIMHI